MFTEFVSSQGELISEVAYFHFCLSYRFIATRHKIRVRVDTCRDRPAAVATRPAKKKEEKEEMQS